MDKDKTKYTIIRRGLEPLNVTIELHSDQHPLAVDVAMAALQLAIESLEENMNLWGEANARHQTFKRVRDCVAQCKHDVGIIGRG